jgi:hypothetical protein
MVLTEMSTFLCIEWHKNLFMSNYNFSLRTQVADLSVGVLRCFRFECCIVLKATTFRIQLWPTNTIQNRRSPRSGTWRGADWYVDIHVPGTATVFPGAQFSQVLLGWSCADDRLSTPTRQLQIAATLLYKAEAAVSSDLVFLGSQRTLSLSLSLSLISSVNPRH